MAWTERYEPEGRYLVALTDGYLGVPTAKRVREGPGRLEERVAKHLNYLARGLHLSERQRAGAGPQPDPVHVWIIGEDGWVDRAPDLFRQIADAETDPSYRIIVAGIDLKPLGDKRYIGGFSDWIRTAGVTKKKRHDDLPVFRDRSGILLNQLCDQYLDTGVAPTSVVAAWGVPYAYYGG